MTQWFRLHAAIARGRCLIPGRETKISHAAGQLSPHATTREACVPSVAKKNKKKHGQLILNSCLFFHLKSYGWVLRGLQLAAHRINFWPTDVFYLKPTEYFKAENFGD